ncbi:MAG: tetratricopeptide repeat protein [Candidatus Tantalella remota]|nr:tetratricopeptide repeat protein [Candidatus Tantalella remota]
MRAKSIAIAIVCLFIAGFLAVKIDLYDQIYAIDHPESDVPVFMRFLGEGRSIVSSLSILQADRYFHGGVGHFSDEHEKGIAIAEQDPKIGESPDEHILTDLSPFNILFRLSDEIDVTEHVHLHGDQVKEIIPWLYYAAEIDPHNIQAYVLTGFYVCDRLGKVDQSIAFLQEGLRRNPDSWELNAELGRIYFQHIKNYEVSAQYLSRAWALLQEAPHDKFQERYVLSFLARSYEAMGRDDKAAPFFDRIKELFPKFNI